MSCECNIVPHCTFNKAQYYHHIKSSPDNFTNPQRGNSFNSSHNLNNTHIIHSTWNEEKEIGNFMKPTGSD